jgi:hypothetical protein
MAQDYQSVGQLSKDADAIAAKHEGWPDDVPVNFAPQATDHDLSFYADRANLQIFGATMDQSMAEHTEPSMAAFDPTPFDDTKASTA